MTWLSEPASLSTQPARSTAEPLTLTSSNHSPSPSGTASGSGITSVKITSPAPGPGTWSTQVPSTQACPSAAQSFPAVGGQEHSKPPSVSAQSPGAW